MTMANMTVSSTPRNGVSLRKTNKPLMEKRRRARINDSLTQLKSLVIHSSKKDSSQFSKLEKADILELTVKHLRGLQQQQQQQQVNSADNSINNKYRSGFVECANEVIRYLDQSQAFNNDTKTKVVSHLAQCLQLASHVQPKQVVCPPQQTTTAILSVPSQPATATSATTTTQLPNGQIIQIVSNPIQSIQPATAAGIVGFKQPVSSIQGFNLSSSIPSSSASTQSNAPNVQAAQTAYVRYTQPLHIQIPPLVSPVLIQPQTPAAKTSTKEIFINSSNSSDDHAVTAQDVVSSSTSFPSSPSRASSTSSTPPSNSSLPKVRAQKQLNFYSPEEMSVDLISRSRTFSMTSSSSSSSSPETEMTSPLNLSQSPPFSSSYSQKFELRFPHHQHKSSSHAVPLSEHYHHNIMTQPIPVKAHEKSSTIVNAIPAHNHNGQIFQERKSGFNTTSVIVNSRKYSDLLSDSKYLTMMDEGRHCMSHHSTPSPASSMGEERVWRPW